MLSFLARYGQSVHSQNSEDGIIAECLSRIGLDGWRSGDGPIHDMARRPGHCVETGGNDGLWMSNIRLLLECGWSGLFVEADYSLYLKCKQNWQWNSRVRSQCSRVNGNNINAFVGDTCDLLSLDTDGGDYEIFRGLKARPRIVIVEIDSSIEPPREEFNAEGGASYCTMVKLAIEKGYFVLCHTGNLVLLRDDLRGLFPEVVSDGLRNADEYFNRGWIRA